MNVKGDWTSNEGGTFRVSAKNDSPGFSEYSDLTLNPEYTYHNKKIVPEINAYGWVKLKIEVYPKENIAQIYIDNEFRGELASVYSVNAERNYTLVDLYTTSGSNGSLYVDDVRCESIVKTYVSKTCVNVNAPCGEDKHKHKEEKPEDPETPDTPVVPAKPAGHYDFNDSQTGTFNIEGVSGSFKNGYSLVMENPEDASGRVLCYNTVSGGNETLTFNAAKVDKFNTNVVEFELYMNSCSSNKAAAIQVKIGECFLLYIYSDEGGNSFSIYESASTSVGKDYAHKKPIKENLENRKWHKIRVEYAIFDGRAMAKIYIGGELLTVSDNFMNDNGTVTSPPTKFENLRFTSLSSTTMSFHLDNVVVTQTTDVMEKAEYTTKVWAE